MFNENNKVFWRFFVVVDDNEIFCFKFISAFVPGAVAAISPEIFNFQIELQ